MMSLDEKSVDLSVWQIFFDSTIMLLQLIGSSIDALHPVNYVFLEYGSCNLFGSFITI